MSYELCESAWLSSRNNALKVLAWCIGSYSLASSFVKSVENYVLLPISSDSIRRMRMTMIDHEKGRTNIATCLLGMIMQNSIPCIALIYILFHMTYSISRTLAIKGLFNFTM